MQMDLPVLLVVEDDDGLCQQYKWAFKGLYTTIFSRDKESALSLFEKNLPSVVLLDLGLPPDEANATVGLSILKEMLKKSPLTQVVVVTGSEQRQDAVDAVSLGACDFQSKGASIESLKLSLKRAFNMSSLLKENKLSRFSLGNSESNIIGKSPAFSSALNLAKRIAQSPLTAMLLGESGVGKEVFANYIHNSSGRTGEMVAINCASIPSELLESELFGHEKGSFTGAISLKVGKIERAHGGTLFLDEIGDMPLVLQAKLLRFLQEREIERVGGKKTFPVDVRVICATHQDLGEMVEKKTFRQDLFYRLSEVCINIPSLKERFEDIELLSNWFLEYYSTQYGKTLKSFTAGAIKKILSHDWPGNVRELQNCVKSAVVMSEGFNICAEDVNIRGFSSDVLIGVDSDIDDEIQSLNDVRRLAETSAILNAYKAGKGNIAEASRLLAITRPTFYALVERHGIVLPDV